MRVNQIPVFYYHSVSPLPDSAWYKSFLTFSLDCFEDLLKYLSSNKYEFLTLDEYSEKRFDPLARNKKMICITFDDGYLDNYVYVYPLLKRYKAKGTVFVTPLYVQDGVEIRPTLEDVWAGKADKGELLSSGFISWKEMDLMQQSGIMDIQSHTLTHTKYYSDDTIREFHHPLADWLYPIGNMYPEKLPWYITDNGFKTLIPYGTPFFTERSSLICKRVIINKEFETECVNILSDHNWNSYSFKESMLRTREIYDQYRTKDKLVIHRETEEEYLARVRFEISESKRILESKLNKTVNHICWPHGDYNDICHATAKDCGYTSSHIVLKRREKNLYPDRFDRTGSSMVKRNRILSLWKAIYKLESYRKTRPYSWVKSIYEFTR